MPGGCYQVVRENLNSIDSGLRCRSLHQNAHLLVINDAAEQSAVASMIDSIDSQCRFDVFLREFYGSYSYIGYVTFHSVQKLFSYKVFRNISLRLRKEVMFPVAAVCPSCVLLSTFHWHQNSWPWITCVKFCAALSGLAMSTLATWSRDVRPPLLSGAAL